MTGNLPAGRRLLLLVVIDAGALQKLPRVAGVLMRDQPMLRLHTAFSAN